MKTELKHLRGGQSVGRASTHPIECVSQASSATGMRNGMLKRVMLNSYTKIWRIRKIYRNKTC